MLSKDKQTNTESKMPGNILFIKCSCLSALIWTPFFFTHGSSQSAVHKKKKKRKSPADPPSRDVPGAYQGDHPREQQHLHRDRAAAEGQLGTLAGGRGSERGASVTGAPLPRSATSGNAMQLADVDGWS